MEKVSSYASIRASEERNPELGKNKKMRTIKFYRSVRVRLIDPASILDEHINDNLKFEKSSIDSERIFFTVD